MLVGALANPPAFRHLKNRRNKLLLLLPKKVSVLHELIYVSEKNLLTFSRRIHKLASQSISGQFTQVNLTTYLKNNLSSQRIVEAGFTGGSAFFAVNPDALW